MKLKNLILLTLSLCFSYLSFADGRLDEKKGKIFINKRSAGTIVFTFENNGDVHYTLDFADGSFYEYEGTYRSMSNKIDITLKEGKGMNSAGISMDHLNPERSEIQLIKKGEVLIDHEYNRNIVFKPLKKKKKKKEEAEAK